MVKDSIDGEEEEFSYHGVETVLPFFFSLSYILLRVEN